VEGHPAVVKVAGGLAGPHALPGVGVVEWVHSVRKCGRGQEGLKRWLAGLWRWFSREGSSLEGLGRAWAVSGTVGSSG